MPLHQEPGQTGVGRGRTRPASRGEPGLWPGFGRVGQGIKKNGKPRRKLERKSEKTNGLHSTWKGQGWPGSKLAIARNISRKLLVWPAIQLALAAADQGHELVIVACQGTFYQPGQD